MKKNIKPKKSNAEYDIKHKKICIPEKVFSIEYDILNSEIMNIKNRLNAIESAGTYQRTTTYISPRIKVDK